MVILYNYDMISPTTPMLCTRKSSRHVCYEHIFKQFIFEQYCTRVRRAAGNNKIPQRMTDGGRDRWDDRNKRKVAAAEACEHKRRFDVLIHTIITCYIIHHILFTYIIISGRDPRTVKMMCYLTSEIRLNRNVRG